MKKMVILVDLDGTLADSSYRSHYLLDKEEHEKDWEGWVNATHTDKPVRSVSVLCEALLSYGVEVIFFTARSEKSRENTRLWLKQNLFGLSNCPLVMREAEDQRPDVEVKEDMLNMKILPKYDVLFAIDDKEEVIEMFERYNVHTLRVNNFGKGE